MMGKARGEEEEERKRQKWMCCEVKASHVVIEDRLDGKRLKREEEKRDA